MTAERADVLFGKDTVGAVTKGEHFRVERVNDPWFLITIKTRDGRRQKGWIHSKNVQRTPEAKTPLPSPSSARHPRFSTVDGDGWLVLQRHPDGRTTLLVYISGHGFTAGQRYYFTPHEFEQESQRFEDDVREYGYPSDELADAICDIPALKRVLVLDTCNSGAALGRSDTRRRNAFAFQGAIERLSHAQGIFTLSAASSSQDTVEVEQLGHGVLTYSLLAGLNAVDQSPLAGTSVHPKNGSISVVSVLDWFSYANKQVPQLTKQFLGQDQDVKMSGEGTSFPILPLKAN